MAKTAEKKSVYQVITERLIEKMESGRVPWRETWQRATNPKTKTVYSGVNRLMLSGEGVYFLTYKQAQEMGGNVKKGAKGLPVVYMAPAPLKKVVFEDEPDKEYIDSRSGGTICKYYTVFRAEDIEGINFPEPAEFQAIKTAENIFSEYKNPPVLTHSGAQPVYIPSEDRINIPEMGFFKNPEAYYSSLFHEAIHSTGAKNRLDRKAVSDRKGTIFNESAENSLEELVAEIGSAFLCESAGVQKDLENAGAYLRGWISFLKNDPRAIVIAAGQAEKGAKHILGVE